VRSNRYQLGLENYLPSSGLGIVARSLAHVTLLKLALRVMRVVLARMSLNLVRLLVPRHLTEV
jgi:hypothetical protein